MYSQNWENPIITVQLQKVTKYKAVQPAYTEALYKPLNITQNSRELVDLSTEKDPWQ